MFAVSKTRTLHSLINCLIGSLLLVTFPILAADGPGELQRPHFNVGYRVLDLPFEGPGQSGSLRVAVWYPTTAEPETYNYGGPTVGKVVPDAELPANNNNYPLLVFSHGFGGSGLSSVFFTEALASMGWIVACPDHHDKYSAVRIATGAQEEFSRLDLWRYAREIAASGPGDRSKYLYRLQEMKLTLNGILRNDTFARYIDRDRIAVGGHSFGGFTALGLSGTLSDYHDPRIKAVLLFSTGAGGYLYTRQELQAVRIPSMLFMGENEATQHRGSKTILELSQKIFDNVATPKYFLELKGGNHFSFNNRFTDNFFSKRMSGTEEQFAVIRRYSIAFLDRYVVGSKASDQILKQSDPRLSRIKFQTSEN